MNQISLTVNGRKVTAAVEPRTSLADFLRNHLRLTGTHLGCEHGVCGACTIQIDGAPARSCIAFAVTLDGAELRTVEGFEDDPVMARIRDAFHQEHALQCGFCTPGMLITARDIVTRLAGADEVRIRAELAGNLCRCTGYMGIVNAIQRVMRKMPQEARLRNKAPPMQVPTPALPAAGFRAFAPKHEMSSPEPVQLSSNVATPEKGWSRLTDSFTVARPRAEVWRLFADLPRMARCMPGASLNESDGRDLKGEVRVALGPIRASFAGTATVERDDTRLVGVLRGGGSDRGGGSRAKGQVMYRLDDIDGGATRVDITLDYALQGPLAQFGRSGLVRDFAGRLVVEFARNLAAELDPASAETGNVASEPAGEFRPGGMVWAMLWVRLKRWLGL